MELKNDEKRERIDLHKTSVIRSLFYTCFGTLSPSMTVSSSWYVLNYSNCLSKNGQFSTFNSSSNYFANSCSLWCIVFCFFILCFNNCWIESVPNQTRPWNEWVTWLAFVVGHGLYLHLELWFFKKKKALNSNAIICVLINSLPCTHTCFLLCYDDVDINQVYVQYHWL